MIDTGEFGTMNNGWRRVSGPQRVKQAEGGQSSLIFKFILETGFSGASNLLKQKAKVKENFHIWIEREIKEAIEVRAAIPEAIHSGSQCGEGGGGWCHGDLVWVDSGIHGLRTLTRRPRQMHAKIWTSRQGFGRRRAPSLGASLSKGKARVPGEAQQ